MKFIFYYIFPIFGITHQLFLFDNFLYNEALDTFEAMNGMARAIFFGKQGELRERTIQHQLQRASALNIIINAISIWNNLHLTKAVEYQKRTGSFNEDLLHHMSPLGWEHINLLGEYHFNSEKVVSLDSLRPLKLS